MFCNSSSRDFCGFSFLLKGCYGLEEIHYSQGCLDMQFLVQNLGCLKTHLLEAMRETLYKLRRLLVWVTLYLLRPVEYGRLTMNQLNNESNWKSLTFDPPFVKSNLPSCESASYLIEDRLLMLCGLKIDFHIRKFKGTFLYGMWFQASIYYLVDLFCPLKYGFTFQSYTSKHSKFIFDYEGHGHSGSQLCATTTTLCATGNLPSKGKPSHREQCQS
jgi:hypothetical protein